MGGLVDLVPGLVPPGQDTNGSSPDAEDLDAKTLVDGFAKKGIACAVLRPDSEDDLTTQATMVAAFADIVVLDWVLDRDNGMKATRLIRKILGDRSDSERMRLIAIYTGESDLGMVAERAAEALSEHYDGNINRPSHFVAQKGSVRVVVFGKEYTRLLREDTALSERIVRTSELPSQLISEFAEMTKGLLSNVAIAGLSEVRVQTHKLLARFSHTLDPAYLGHRLLLPNPSEAEDHVVAMLAAELESILEDGNVARQVGIDAICCWIKEMMAREAMRPESLPLNLSQSDESRQEILLRLLDGGFYDTEGVSLGRWQWEKATHAFASKDNCADRSNRQFARMMHIKTRYGSSRPSLTLGTILFSESDGCTTYWICLQPRCDSVRNRDPRAFPMVPLKHKKDQRCDFGIVVWHCNSWVLLSVPLSPSEINMFIFHPNDQPSGQVTATQGESSVWKMQTTDGLTFEWVAELKNEYAQRIANDFAGSLSRVGVNESEWVRRSGKS